MLFIIIIIMIIIVVELVLVRFNVLILHSIIVSLKSGKIN